MVIDIIFALLAIYGFYIGFSRGIIQTIFTILAYVIGLIAAFRFGPEVTDFLESAFNYHNPLMFVAGFLLSFILTMLLIRLFARGLEGILETVHINIVNQVAGGVLMGAIMILVYSLLVWFADRSNILSQDLRRQSITYPYLKEYPAYVWKAGGKLKPIFENFWDHTVEFMDQLEDTGGVEQTESEPTFYDIEEDNGNQ
jgi:uncharacterized membrane protein required for colicin V production